MKNRCIITITRNSSHIWKYFVNSYKKYCKNYDLIAIDNHSRKGDVEYLDTYVDDGTICQLIKLDANYLFTYSINYALKFIEKENYEQIILANPDIEFLEGWDKDLDKNEGIMGFVLVKPNGIIEHAGAYGKGEHIGRGEIDKGQYNEIRDVEWVTFGAVTLNSGVVDKLGKLNKNNFPHFGSDKEYCMRAHGKNIPVKCSGARLIHGFGKSTKPYIFEEIPDDIWKKHVTERRKSGVNFPSKQSDCKQVDAPGRYMDLVSGKIVG